LRRSHSFLLVWIGQEGARIIDGDLMDFPWKAVFVNQPEAEKREAEFERLRTRPAP